MSAPNTSRLRAYVAETYRVWLALAPLAALLMIEAILGLVHRIFARGERMAFRLGQRLSDWAMED